MYDGIVIGDQHFGAMDSKKLYREHELIFFPYLKSLEKLDFIIINGDFFDRKMYLNDLTVEYSERFMRELCVLAKEKHSKIRIVYGTESHDSDQYKVFNLYLEDPTLDIKVIRTVQEEELLPNLFVLYLPEEFMYDKHEYYKDTLYNNDKKYDYIFGHGVIKDIMVEATRHSSSEKAKRLKVPYFSYHTLSKRCKGRVYFNHYHIHTVMKENVCYVGSYSRWKFGEEEAKGFYHIWKDTDTYGDRFIENYLADTYKTVYFGYQHPIFQKEENILPILNRIDHFVDTKTYDHLRFDFDIPANYDHVEMFVNLIRERYKFNKHYKILLNQGMIEKKEKINNEVYDKTMNAYGFILDKSRPIEEKISCYIKLRFEKEISKEDVHYYLYENIFDDYEKPQK